VRTSYLAGCEGDEFGKALHARDIVYDGHVSHAHSEGKGLSFGAISLAHQCLYFFYIFFRGLNMHCVRVVFVVFLLVIDSHESTRYFFTKKLRKDFSEVLVVGRSGGVQ
jgi:hypothetical protein